MLNTEYVQELMDDHGWTLGQLSTRSGISKAQLSRLFRDKRGAGAKTMEGILHAFPEADKEKLFLRWVLPKGSKHGFGMSQELVTRKKNV